MCIRVKASLSQFSPLLFFWFFPLKPIWQFCSELPMVTVWRDYAVWPGAYLPKISLSFLSFELYWWGFKALEVLPCSGQYYCKGWRSWSESLGRVGRHSKVHSGKWLYTKIWVHDHYRPWNILNTVMWEAECVVRHLDAIAKGAIGENTKIAFFISLSSIRNDDGDFHWQIFLHEQNSGGLDGFQWGFRAGTKPSQVFFSADTREEHAGSLSANHFE